MGHRGLGWLFASLSVACAQGGPGASTGLTFGSLGEGGETTGGTTEDTTSETTSTSTDASTTGADASSTGTTAALPSCEDATHNGDETDVDCGGPCPPCEIGQACVEAVDCNAMLLCEGELCCLETTYERSTGQISGSATVCCDGSDERLSLVECGSGVNYSVQEEGANCASTAEGAMNNGTACVTVTCRILSCSAADTGTT